MADKYVIEMERYHYAGDIFYELEEEYLLLESFGYLPSSFTIECSQLLTIICC